MQLANGGLVKIEKVWCGTRPLGAYRVTYREGGELKGCAAWYRKGEWVQSTSDDVPTEEDRLQAKDLTEELF